MQKNEQETLIDDLLDRSIAQVLPLKEKLKEKLLSGEKLRIYIGADATGPQLHLGHATNFILLEKLRRLGHKVYVLFGDFTAMIGDPTDKSATRVRLSWEQVEEHIKSWKEQVSKLVDFNDPENPAEIVRNSTWHQKMTFDKVIDLAANFTVQQMMERDMFEKRAETKIKCNVCGFEWGLKNKMTPSGISSIKSGKDLVEEFVCKKCNTDHWDEKSLEKDERTYSIIPPSPVFLHEFMYPLMQGWDSVMLDVDVEIGGTDQTFNMLAGRTLQRKYNNREKFVISTTLLENPKTGKKLMSKSEGGYIALNDAPEDMFGKVMALPDEVVRAVFKDCTFVPMEEVDALVESALSGEVNPRDIKMRLGEEIVKIYYGEKAAEDARAHFTRVFQEHSAPEEMDEVEVAGGTALVDVLVNTKLATSKTNARQLIEQGGVKLGDRVVTDVAETIDASLLPLVLQKGKRGFVRLIR